MTVLNEGSNVHYISKNKSKNLFTLISVDTIPRRDVATWRIFLRIVMFLYGIWDFLHTGPLKCSISLQRILASETQATDR